MSAESFLLERGIEQSHIDVLLHNGIENKKLLMSASIRELSSMLKLCTAGAICFYNTLRDNFQIPYDVGQTLHSAEIPPTDAVYFIRLEIANVEQLKRLTVEDFTQVMCPYLVAHKLVDTLAAHFNNKRKRTTKGSLIQGSLILGSKISNPTEKRLRTGSYQTPAPSSVEEGEQEDNDGDNDDNDNDDDDNDDDDEDDDDEDDKEDVKEAADGFECYDVTWRLRKINMSIDRFKLLSQRFKIKRKALHQKRYQYRYEWMGKVITGSLKKKFTALLPLLRDLQDKISI